MTKSEYIAEWAQAAAKVLAPGARLEVNMRGEEDISPGLTAFFEDRGSPAEMDVFFWEKGDLEVHMAIVGPGQSRSEISVTGLHGSDCSLERVFSLLDECARKVWPGFVAPPRPTRPE